MDDKWLNPSITVAGMISTVAAVWGSLGQRVKALETAITELRVFRDQSMDRLARIETKIDRLLERHVE